MINNDFTECQLNIMFIKYDLYLLAVLLKSFLLCLSCDLKKNLICKTKFIKGNICRETTFYFPGLFTLYKLIFFIKKIQKAKN